MADNIVSASQHAAVVADLNAAKSEIQDLEARLRMIYANTQAYYNAHHVLVAFVTGLALGSIVFGLVL